MGGTHETTKVKRELKIVSKTAIAIERAKKELERKDLEKDLPVWLRDRFGKMIENTDLIEFTGLVGLTILIKAAIDKSEEIKDGIHPIITWGNLFVTLPEGYKAVFSGIPFWYDIIKEDEKYEGWLPDSMDWLVAFGLAFLIVRHGDALLKAGTSIGSFVSGLILK